MKRRCPIMEVASAKANDPTNEHSTCTSGLQTSIQCFSSQEVPCDYINFTSLFGRTFQLAQCYCCRISLESAPQGRKLETRTWASAPFAASGCCNHFQHLPNIFQTIVCPFPTYSQPFIQVQSQPIVQDVIRSCAELKDVF